MKISIFSIYQVEFSLKDSLIISSILEGGGHALELISKPKVPKDLSWLHVDPDTEHVYAIHESSGHVSRLKLSSDFTKVETLESVKLPGTGPAHLLVDQEKVGS